MHAKSFNTETNGNGNYHVTDKVGSVITDRKTLNSNVPKNISDRASPPMVDDSFNNCVNKAEYFAPNHAATKTPGSGQQQPVKEDKDRMPYSVLSGKQLPPLLEWKDVPRHLQFNPYVLTGYRHLLSSWGCLHSLFYLHNETVNIFTHGIPIVYIVVFVPGLLPWDVGGGVRFLSWCHLLGALAPWCGSFLYHLFMNHDCGSNLYRLLLQLDMLGIWVSQSFGALPMVTATVYCSPFILKYAVILSYCMLSVWGLFKAMTAWSPWQRRLCFLFPFVMRIALACLRAVRLGGGDPASMLHVILQDAVSVVGGLIGAMNIPERWFPGTFDYCFNSHNIMHILVVSAVYSMHQVTVQDLRWMTHTKCLPGEDHLQFLQEL